MHHNYHQSLWNKGYQNYYYHTPLEYKIIDKPDNYLNDEIWYKLGFNEIKIQPLTIGDKKEDFIYLEKNKIMLKDYSFWIPRKRIRRGPGSFKRNEDRWVHKKTFLKCLIRAVKGNPFYEEEWYYD